MKKLLFAMLAMITCLSLLLGCDDVSGENKGAQNASTNLSSDQEEAAPSDFAIHFELWINGNQRDILDTYEGYVQKGLVADGVAKEDYEASYAELCQLYQFVLALERRVELDFSKPVTYDNHAMQGDFASVSLLACYYLKFTANGKTVEISGDSTANMCVDQSEEARYFMQSVSDIYAFYLNTEVYKAMPEASGGYQ